MNEALSYRMIVDLFRKKEQLFMTLAISYVHDKETAKDIISDSFISLWEHRQDVMEDKYADDLYRRIRNRCLDYRRNNSRHKAVFDKISEKERGLMEYYSRAIESCNPSLLYAQEINVISEKSLMKLPETTRKIFLLKRYEGKSYKEISEIMNISVGKIDYELRRAMNLLRTTLVDYINPAIISLTLGIYLYGIEHFLNRLYFI